MVVLINFYRTTIKEPVIITRIKRGVDKTRNKEHSGTSRNIPEHEKNKSNFHGKKNYNNNIVFVKINNNKIT